MQLLRPWLEWLIGAPLLAVALMLAGLVLSRFNERRRGRTPVEASWISGATVAAVVALLPMTAGIVLLRAGYTYLVAFSLGLAVLAPIAAGAILGLRAAQVAPRSRWWNRRPLVTAAVALSACVLLPLLIASARVVAVGWRAIPAPAQGQFRGVSVHLGDQENVGPRLTLRWLVRASSLEEARTMNALPATASADRLESSVAPGVRPGEYIVTRSAGIP